MSTFRRYVAAPLSEGRAPRSLAFLASAIPLGTAWFVMLVTGWSLGLGLLITLLGIPVILVLGVASSAGWPTGCSAPTSPGRPGRSGPAARSAASGAG